MAMRALTAIELAANAAERWRRQYEGWAPEGRFADGTTKASVDAALNAAERHTPDVIAKIINKGWAYPQCNHCGKHVPVTVQFARDFSDDVHELCVDCLRTALTMAEQFEAGK